MRPPQAGIFLLALFVTFSMSAAEDSRGSSYWPLGMGYEWNYSNPYNPYFSHSETIVDTLWIGGLLYHGLATGGEQVDYWLRQDSSAIYLMNEQDSTGFLLFDFDADTGSGWDLPAGYECSFGTRITLTGKEDTVITPADTFFNAYHFEHRRGCADAGMLDTWFAEGVGKVRYFEDNFGGMLEYVLSSYSLAVSGIDQREPWISGTYRLNRLYPNPFNPTTTIEFSIPQSGLVTLTVYDLLGREVETVLNEDMDAGRHEVQWNAGNIPSGIYVLKMRTEGYSQTRKVTVLK